MVHKFVTRPIYPAVQLRKVPCDNVRRHCTRCNCTHGYWSGGACIICANHKVIQSNLRSGAYGKQPDYSDRNTAEQE